MPGPAIRGLIPGVVEDNEPTVAPVSNGYATEDGTYRFVTESGDIIVQE